MTDESPEGKLRQLSEEQYEQWREKQYEKACRMEKRWKTHTDTSHGNYEYHNAIRMKRMVQESAAYCDQNHVYQDAVNEVCNILSRSMERNEMAASIYVAVMDTLNHAVSKGDAYEDLQ